MTGLELVAGYLAAWAMRKARRAAGRVDRDIDRALDAAMDRLYALVFDKLGADPALKRLQDDAQRRMNDPRTHKRVQLSVEDAADQDPRFAAELRQVLQQLQDPRFAAELRQMLDQMQSPDERGLAVRAVGKARDITQVTGRGNQVCHRFGAIGAVMVVLIGAVTFIYYLSTHGGPPASEVGYQQQVLTTCEQAHGVLSADYSGRVLRFYPNVADLTDPRQMVVVDKAALLGVLNDKLAQIKAAFGQLDQREVPPSLRDQKKAADQAFAAWLTSFQQGISTVQTAVRDGMNLAQLQQRDEKSLAQLQKAVPATVQGEEPDITRTLLVSTMSDLAGKTCSI